MDKITIYTNETCPYCKAVKEKLTEEKIEFNERLTKDWPKLWNKIVSTVGVSTVPTIFYKQEYFIPGRDFANPVALVNTLQNFTANTDTDSFVTLQRLKTLTYNIATAFSRTNQILTQIETKINTDEHKSTN